MAGASNRFKGYIDIQDNKIEDASIQFQLEASSRSLKQIPFDTYLKTNNIYEVNSNPLISFKSTSFQKINNNINFLKGNLTIKNITKVVELDAEFIGINSYNGVKKAAFEIIGMINHADFNITPNSFNQADMGLGKQMKIIANLEFSL